MLSTLFAEGMPHFAFGVFVGAVCALAFVIYRVNPKLQELSRITLRMDTVARAAITQRDCTIAVLRLNLQGAQERLAALNERLERGPRG